jgi:hypothetical protein
MTVAIVVGDQRAREPAENVVVKSYGLAGVVRKVEV